MTPAPVRGGAVAADALRLPIFFDTNVLVYAYDPDEPARRQRALWLIREAMRESRFVISTQVMQEFFSMMLRRHFLPAPRALDVLRELAEHPVVPASGGSVLRAAALQQRSRLSIWDALIVQAALDAGCGTLFTEDLQNGQRFAATGDAPATVTVIDPFASGGPSPGLAVHEPRAAYGAAAPKPKRPTRRPAP